MRLDLRKLRFRQPKLVATHLCLLFGSRESRHYVRANTFMGPDPSSRRGPSAWSPDFAEHSPYIILVRPNSCDLAADSFGGTSRAMRTLCIAAGAAIALTT